MESVTPGGTIMSVKVPEDCNCGWPNPETRTTPSGHAPTCPVDARARAWMADVAAGRREPDRPRSLCWLWVRDVGGGTEVGAEPGRDARRLTVSAPYPFHLAADEEYGVVLYSPSGQVRLRAAEIYAAATEGRFGLRFEDEGSGTGNPT
jgi:hypothetical protein